MMAKNVLLCGVQPGWLLDQVKGQPGVTVDTDTLKFMTRKIVFSITLEDMGYPMLGVDCAVLVSDFSAGGSVHDQTLKLVQKLRGIPIICCCNKFDGSKAEYENIVKKASSSLEKAGYNPNKIPFVPISEDGNMVEWYKGPSLVEALDQIIEPKKPSDKCPQDEIDDRSGVSACACIPNRGAVRVNSTAGPNVGSENASKVPNSAGKRISKFVKPVLRKLGILFVWGAVSAVFKDCFKECLETDAAA